MEIKEIIEKLDRIHNLLAKSDLTDLPKQVNETSDNI